ncbi:helix-turn-helix transcriptional regulator [Streptomyces sp. NPDC059544]|uniref:helix-turn-helix transcriptional regulator n=1 Tax=Streptomyces sp. NPDC059544 TaxID=3346861 RepID=UPI0036AF563F
MRREPHMKLADVLDELGMSRAAFYRMRARGQAPKCLKLPNGQLRFRRTEFEKWLNGLEENTTC